MQFCLSSIRGVWGDDGRRRVWVEEAVTLFVYLLLQ